MALPGGGIVSVPLASAEASSIGSNSNRALSPAGVVAPSSSSAPPGASAPSPRAASAAAAAAAASSAAQSGDVLTVNAGEPVTHFNLDQLLEIVQSFQLDTTMAGHEEGEQAARLNLVLQAAAAANSTAAAAGAEGAGIQVRVGGEGGRW